MRKEQERPGPLDRRRFLKGAGFALGAASTAVTGKAIAAVEEKNKPQEYNGYRETELVKTYYEAARF